MPNGESQHIYAAYVVASDGYYHDKEIPVLNCRSVSFYMQVTSDAIKVKVEGAFDESATWQEVIAEISIAAGSDWILEKGTHAKLDLDKYTWKLLRLCVKSSTGSNPAIISAWCNRRRQ